MQVKTADVTIVIQEPVIRDGSKNRPAADGVNMIVWNDGSVPKNAMTWGRAFAFPRECDVVVELTTPYIRGDVVHTLRHEFGHCLGLAHSVAESIMARYSHRLGALTYDDEVGLSVLFPKSASLEKTTVTLRGQVVRWNGDPVMGAVLTLIDGSTRRPVLAGFSGLVHEQQQLDRSGNFELPGIPPGRHQLLIRPASMYGGITDGHHGLPTDESTLFRPMTVELPNVEAGDMHDAGKLTVTD
jgi:hypothetical protein